MPGCPAATPPMSPPRDLLTSPRKVPAAARKPSHSASCADDDLLRKSSMWWGILALKIWSEVWGAGGG